MNEQMSQPVALSDDAVQALAIGQQTEVSGGSRPRLVTDADVDRLSAKGGGAVEAFATLGSAGAAQAFSSGAGSRPRALDEAEVAMLIAGEPLDIGTRPVLAAQL